MRTVYAHLAKTFEDHIFRLIGEYAGSVHPGCDKTTYNLVFRTTKRRHLGSILVECTHKNHLLRRHRLLQQHWIRVVSPHIGKLICGLRRTKDLVEEQGDWDLSVELFDELMGKLQQSETINYLLQFNPNGMMYLKHVYLFGDMLLQV